MLDHAPVKPAISAIRDMPSIAMLTPFEGWFALESGCFFTVGGLAFFSFLVSVGAVIGFTGISDPSSEGISFGEVSSFMDLSTVVVVSSGFFSC